MSTQINAMSASPVDRSTSPTSLTGVSGLPADDQDPPRARILIVDDVPANLHTLSRALGDDYELSVATSGPAALALAEKLAPELILLDVMMPGIDGIETLTRLRATDWGRDIPVILVTADERTETQVLGLERGAEDFLTKPIVVPVVRVRVRNVLERHRLRRELVRLATTDALTGLLNRRRFFTCGESEHHLLMRYDHPCGLLMIDLDHFKTINDHYGHAVGDAALRAVGQAMASLLRDPDRLGRIGGEEFGLLLPHTERQGTLALAERVRAAVADLQLEGPDGDHLALRVSIGSTQLRAADRDFDEALHRADTALYAAKAAGRNRVEEELAPDASVESGARAGVPPAR